MGRRVRLGRGVALKVGIRLPIAETDSGTILRYGAIRDAALQAERDQFDSIWIVDHLLFEWDGQRRGIWEGWTLLAALAEATTRIELGTLVMCTAFRNPALLAKMADAVDEVSAGRLILGLGAGWHEPEFRAFGYPFDHLASRFADALRIIAPMVRGEVVDYQGTYEQVFDCVSLPRGPRPEGPPILIGASRPRMLRLTAELGDAWNTCWLGRAGELQPRLAELQAACSAVGRDPATLDVTVGQIVATPKATQDRQESDSAGRFEFTSSEVLADEWRSFEEQGVTHLIVWPQPYDDACLQLVTTALPKYRARSSQ
jgi:alkanesulfonate monooxygenase SsuD/methylene tetrahydromethanopterin reductase-like flavin-dependent oxidoreductase (luciferase family)